MMILCSVHISEIELLVAMGGIVKIEYRKARSENDSLCASVCFASLAKEELV